MATTMSTLDEFIEKNSLECLNSKTDNPVANAFKEDDTFLESDADHELLIKVQFRLPIKLAAIRFKGFPTDDTAPTTVRAFTGSPDMGFDDARDADGIQELTLDPAQADKPEEVQVRFVKFQSVQSLQLFVHENAGAETTKIQQIEFVGQPASSMDMKDWK